MNDPGIANFIFGFLDMVDIVTNGTLLLYILNYYGTTNDIQSQAIMNQMNLQFHKLTGFGKVGIIKQHHRNLFIKQKVLNFQAISPPLKPMIIILGLHRSGTTLLHRMLDQDPRSRTLKTWEMLSGPFRPDADAKEEIKNNLDLYHALNPKVNSIHPLLYDQPEEESMIMNRFFTPYQIELYYYLEELQPKELQEMFVPFYDYLKKELEIYQMYSDPFNHWVLKCPHHTVNIPLLRKTFPNSTLVAIDRDPKECIPSFCNLLYYTYNKIVKDPLDRALLGQKQLAYKKLMLESIKDVDILLDYNKFIQNPIQSIQEIYKKANIPIQGITAMQKYFQDTKTTKQGQGSEYSIYDYGFTDLQFKQINSK